MGHPRIRSSLLAVATTLRMLGLGQSRTSSRLRLLAVGVLAISAAAGAAFRGVTAAAPLDDVNQYADRCAAELGGGPGAYMPTEILKNPPDYTGTAEILVHWNEKLITYVATDPTDPGGTGEYKFDGESGRAAGHPMGAYPDGANTTGKIRDKDDLKCDYWSHVNSENGCVPGQRILRKDVGACAAGTANAGKACGSDTDCGGARNSCEEIVTWALIFRREQPPVPGPGAPWGPFHPYWFNNMDAVAFKKDTGATCWFDTIQLDKFSTKEDKWWLPSTWAPGRDTTGVPKGVPRPGGKDAVKKEVAAAFWNPPKHLQNPKAKDRITVVPSERCIACHGNGPILISRWINENDRDEFSDRKDLQLAYWHPAKLFPNPFFKRFDDTTHPKVNCGGACHDKDWSVSASTTPNGSLARAMTTNPIGVDRASFHRLQKDDTGANRVGVCDGGAMNGQVCGRQLDCPGGACKGGQKAGILREMPHPFDVKAPDGTVVAGTPLDWDGDAVRPGVVRPAYEAMRVCRKVCEISAADRPCKTNANCGSSRGVCSVDGFCTILPSLVDTACTDNFDCGPFGRCPNGRCVVGSRGGQLCADAQAPAFADDCPGSRCLDVSKTRFCAGGDRAGLLCQDNAHCPNGGTCPAANARQCEGVKQATIPVFVGPEKSSASAPPDLQRVAPPRKAENFKVSKTVCVTEPNGSERCTYRVSWQDPIAVDSDYYAPDLYYLELADLKSAANQTKPFCVGTSTAVSASTTPVPGSNWAKSYEVPHTLEACRTLEVRLCGGYEFDSTKDANDKHSPVRSNDEGQVWPVLATACPVTDPSLTGSVTRVGETPPAGQLGGAQVRISGRFTYTAALDLSESTLNVGALLAELKQGGAGELVKGIGGAQVLPLVLRPSSGSTANSAVFTNPSSERPAFRVEVKLRDAVKGVFDFTIKVDRASVPVAPKLCAGSTPKTDLVTTLTINPAGRPPAVVTTTQAWRCRGSVLSLP